jgi:hypothetical protein
LLRDPPIDFWFGALTDKQLLDNNWDNQDWGTIAAVCKQVADLKAKAEAAFKRSDLAPNLKNCADSLWGREKLHNLAG